MIKIYSAANLIDAQMVCDALQDAGLEASVKGGYLTGAAGELPVDTLVSVWLYEPMHRDRARAIIDTIEKSRNLPATEVSCPHCAEPSTTQFSHCWRCGAVLD